MYLCGESDSKSIVKALILEESDKIGDKRPILLNLTHSHHPEILPYLEELYIQTVKLTRLFESKLTIPL